MKLRNFFERDEGAVALEIGLVSASFLPVLFFGIYEVGTLAVEKMQLDHAMQAGAAFAAEQFDKYGSLNLADIQTAVSNSSPLVITISANPATPWCGCPTDNMGTSLQNVSCGSTCFDGAAARTYFSFSGSTPTNNLLSRGLGFPRAQAVAATLTTPPILVPLN